MNSLKMRILLFLYSNRNIVGCLCAFLGLLLFYSGFIADYWWLIVVGLYAMGYFATPAPPHLALVMQSANADEIEHSLHQLIKESAPHLQRDILQLLEKIKSDIIEVLPKLVSEGVGNDENFYIIKETATSYLPYTINAYLKLPPTFRSAHTIKDGKTAKQLLIEQLTILENKMREILINVAQGDAQALLANGNFLHKKFANKSFLENI